MAEKVKLMKLKVDLECEKCYKKVKKVLCKFPEIRDQVYDQKQNIVTIRVVSSNPETIRDRLCCKGRGSIKSIEIVEQPKPKPSEPEKPKSKPPAEKPKPNPEAPPAEPTKKVTKGPPPVQPKMMFPEPAPVSVLAYPAPAPAIPIGMYYEGHAGYGGYYGRPIYDNYGGDRPGYVGRSDQFFSEENASGCTIV